MFAALWMLVACGGAAAPDGRCGPGEQEFFGCATADGKQVAVCGGPAGAQYRFGAPAAAELVFPATLGAPGLTLADRTDARTHATVLAFDDGPRHYELTDARGDAGEAGFQGVYVSKGPNTVATIRCQGAATTNWDGLRPILGR